MSETFWIILVVALVITLSFFLFRHRIRSFGIKASSGGVEAKMRMGETSVEGGQSPSGTVAVAEGASRIEIRGNRQIGRDNSIAVAHPDVSVKDNIQIGSGQEISVKPKSKNRK